MTRDEAAAEILTRVVEREGGIAQVPGELWVTRYGQTPKWLREFGFTAPETEADAIQNYQTWLVRTRLIGICDFADSLADVVIDFAVHAGHTLAIAHLQRRLGLRQDAIWGPDTQAAVDACDRVIIAGDVLADKMRYHGATVTGNPAKYVRYAHGWFNRDADQVQNLAREGR